MQRVSLNVILPVVSVSLGSEHLRRPRGGHWGRKKRPDESFQAQADEALGADSHRPFPNGQANAGSWLGTKNALYYCAQSTSSISWVLFVSSYATAIDPITACLAYAPKKCTQLGNFQFDINSPFQNTVYPKTKYALAHTKWTVPCVLGVVQASGPLKRPY